MLKIYLHERNGGFYYDDMDCAFCGRNNDTLDDQYPFRLSDFLCRAKLLNAKVEASGLHRFFRIPIV